MFESLVGQLIRLQESTGLMSLLVPAGLVVGGVLLGILSERLVLRRLAYLAASNRWYGDDIVVGSLHGVVTVWFSLLGVYLAVLSSSLSPEVAGFVNTALVVVFVVSIAVTLTRVSAGFIRLHANRVRGLPSSSVLINVAGLVIFVLGGLIVLQSFGIAIAPLLAALGVGGLALALALQETLANFFSGILIVVSGQVRPNDYVKLDSGDEGYVTDITWRNTTVRSMTNNMIIVPNSRLSSSIVTNYYQPDRSLAVILPVGVDYGSDLDRVEEVTLEVAREVLAEVPGCDGDFEPLVRYNGFGEFSVEFAVILQTGEYADQYLAKHELIKRLHRRYALEGIEVPYPLRVISKEASGEPEDGARGDRT